MRPTGWMNPWWIRITHLPTGESVMTDSHSYRSLSQARPMLLDWLRARIAAIRAGIYPVSVTAPRVRQYYGAGTFWPGTIRDVRTGIEMPWDEQRPETMLETLTKADNTERRD